MILSGLAGLLSLLWVLAAPAWNPVEIDKESTLEFLTVGKEDGEHWSTVWFVVIDGEVHLRLGPRAAKRVEANPTAPRMQIRVGGETYTMRYEIVPQKFEAVADAMYAKYWTDRFGVPFRKLGLTSATMTLRLVPDTPAPQTSSRGGSSSRS